MNNLCLYLIGPDWACKVLTEDKLLVYKAKLVMTRNNSPTEFKRLKFLNRLMF